MRFMKTQLAVAGAIVLLGVGVSVASANGNLSSSSQTFRSTFARVDFAGGFGTTECALTLEGTLHERRILKLPGLLAGLVTRVIVGSCPRGSATMLTATLPWHLRYGRFSGSLPFIIQIGWEISGRNFRIREPTFGVQCLAANATANFLTTREAGGALTGAELEGREIETDCGIPGNLSGRSTALTVLGSATNITITLI